MTSQPHTIQTPSPRVHWETLHAQIGRVKRSISFIELSKAKSQHIFLLNAYRQIVFITRSCLDLFGIDDPAEAYGCRPGEMMRCTHAQANGCGESPACQLCGAFEASLDCLKYNRGTRHFQLKQVNHQPIKALTVQTEALTLQGELFMMVSLTEA
jgi:hypothetical protein